MTASERNVMTASVPSMRTEQVTSVTSKKQRTSESSSVVGLFSGGAQTARFDAGLGTKRPDR